MGSIFGGDGADWGYYLGLCSCSSWSCISNIINKLAKPKESTTIRNIININDLLERPPP